MCENKFIENEPSFFTVKGNMITETSPSFVELTGYASVEVVGRRLEEVLRVLRICPEFEYNNPDFNRDYFLFTKGHHYRNIYIREDKVSSECSIYSFLEKQNSRFESKFAGFSKLLEDGNYGIGLYSAPELYLLTANQSYLDMLKEPYNKKEVSIGLHIDEFVDWTEIPGARAVFRELLDTGNTFYGKEIKGITAKWSENYCNNNLIPISEDGRVKYVLSMVEDVTEKVITRKKNEEQASVIEKQKKELDAIIENMSDGLYTIDGNGNLSILNDSAKDAFYNGDANKTISDIFNHTKFYDFDGNPITFEDMPGVKVLSGEKVSESVIKAERPDGTRYFNISGSSIYEDDGNIQKALLCIRDITRKIKGESLVRLYRQTIDGQTEMLYQIIYNLDLPVARISYPDLTITDLNQKARELIKEIFHEPKDRDNKVEYNLVNLDPDFMETDYYKCIYCTVEEKKINYLKGITFILNGKGKYWNVLFEPLFDANGEIPEIVAVIIDVTSEVEANKHMEMVMENQEEFLANISHELKTPLNVIYATTQLFSSYCEQGALDEKKGVIKRYLDTMGKNCLRLSRLVNNIVDLSKIDAGFYELVKSGQNIVYLVEETITSVIQYAESKEVNIIFDTDVEEKIIACDPEKMERVILNLISNAIKFSDIGGEILVEVFDRGAFVEINVTDKGTGIDKSQIDKIFDRFKQVDKSLSRNAEGTGIGLSLVKAIVELHGGRISVESEPGRGSRFTVMLPAVEPGETEDAMNEKIVSSNRQIISMELSDIY
ncbi:MAG: PAS domain-containing sensor histidine kinase [Bacillota bacterium]|nr:PAS domain-containing sensor histidine kinase [Bacillota bacterium]